MQIVTINLDKSQDKFTRKKRSNLKIKTLLIEVHICMNLNVIADRV